MDLEKILKLIVDDLQVNAMPFETYVYEVKATHQIIRKHLEEQLRLHVVGVTLCEHEPVDLNINSILSRCDKCGEMKH